MALRTLQPGLAPDEVEKLRWDTFGHRRTCSIRSSDDLERFTTQRGFVLRHPEPGLHYPSVVEAAVGRPLLEHSWDERGKKAEAWARECVEAGHALYAAVLASRSTLVAHEYIGDFFVLSGQRGDLEDHARAHQQGKLGAEAAALCAWLVREGRPLARSELQGRLQMRGVLGKERLRRALDEVVQRLLVVPVAWRAPVEGEDEPEPICDLLPRAFPEAINAGLLTQPDAARRRIACRYMRNVLVEGCHEMAHVLGWSEADTLAALRALEAQGDVLQHPSSRYNRWFYQTAATDLLPDP